MDGMVATVGSAGKAGLVDDTGSSWDGTLCSAKVSDLAVRPTEGLHGWLLLRRLPSPGGNTGRTSSIWLVAGQPASIASLAKETFGRPQCHVSRAAVSRVPRQRGHAIRVAATWLARGAVGRPAHSAEGRSQAGAWERGGCGRDRGPAVRGPSSVNHSGPRGLLCEARYAGRSRGRGPSRRIDRAQNLRRFDRSDRPSYIAYRYMMLFLGFRFAVREVDARPPFPGPAGAAGRGSSRRLNPTGAALALPTLAGGAPPAAVPGS